MSIRSQIILLLLGFVIAGSSLSVVMATAMQELKARTNSGMSISIMLAASDFGGFLSFLYAEFALSLFPQTYPTSIFSMLFLFSILMVFLLYLVRKQIYK